MIHSIHAVINRHGNLVRTGIARPETVARHLSQVGDLAGYEVRYWLNNQPYRVTGATFLVRYEAGQLPCQQPLKEKHTCQNV